MGNVELRCTGKNREKISGKFYIFPENFEKKMVKFREKYNIFTKFSHDFSQCGCAKDNDSSVFTWEIRNIPFLPIEKSLPCILIKKEMSLKIFQQSESQFKPA